MDPVTHAASGAVAYLAITRRPATLWGLPLAALACASPDLDLLFIHSPLEFLQLHRGITHSLAASPILGLILAVFAWPLWRESTADRWRFWRVWLFCTGMIWLHIWLDIVTTYGTMIFLPFSHYRVRLNSLFIIDALVTLPLLWAVWRWRYRRKLILAVLAWTFIYPAGGVVANLWHTWQWEHKLGGEQTGGPVVFPDMFAPFFWRVVYEEKKTGERQIIEQSLNVLGKERAAPVVKPAADPAIVRKIALDSLAGDTYFKFAVLPVMENLRAEYFPEGEAQDSRLLLFYDLRFGSGIAWVQELLALRPNADMPFLFMAEMLPDPSTALADMTIGRIRLRFSDSGRDSDWHRPAPPPRPTFWQWLVGLN